MCIHVPIILNISPKKNLPIIFSKIQKVPFLLTAKKHQLPNLIICSFTLCIVLPLYTILVGCEEKMIFVSPTFFSFICLKKHIFFLNLMKIKTPRTNYFQTLQKNKERVGGGETKMKRTLRKFYYKIIGLMT